VSHPNEHSQDILDSGRGTISADAPEKIPAGFSKRDKVIFWGSFILFQLLCFGIGVGLSFLLQPDSVDSPPAPPLVWEES
jgi:hypothetical protein